MEALWAKAAVGKRSKMSGSGWQAGGPWLWPRWWGETAKQVEWRRCWGRWTLSSRWRESKGLFRQRCQNSSCFRKPLSKVSWSLCLDDTGLVGMPGKRLTASVKIPEILTADLHWNVRVAWRITGWRWAVHRCKRQCKGEEWIASECGSCAGPAECEMRACTRVWALLFDPGWWKQLQWVLQHGRLRKLKKETQRRKCQLETGKGNV